MARYAGQKVMEALQQAKVMKALQQEEYRKSIDHYDFGYNYPFFAEDIERLNMIAEQITQELGQPLTFENVRRNGIKYFDSIYMEPYIRSEVVDDIPEPATREANNEIDPDEIQF